MRTNVTFLTYVWKCTSKYVTLNSSYTRHCCKTIVRPLCVSTSRSSEKKWLKPSGSDTGIQVYNSLTKQKEPLILADEGIAKWYSCGPTVYDHAHLGHACSYVRFDILQRILSKIFGINVIHVMVITDIDDKIIRRSAEENISPTVLARMYEEDFKQDMLSMKVIPPVVYMRVTDNIAHIVAFIERIIKNGHAYAIASGDVYFDVASIGHRYGKLMNLGDTVGEAEGTNKRDVRDFALWKASKPQEPSWDSPWGPGRPGWHIECSTVASSVFGSQLDIHSGGIDLAFPHHENEIAQCEAHHLCQQWGNYFLHSGHLHLKGGVEKMSKSLKNYITIKDFLQSYTANEFRMFCLLTKYRSGIEYSDESMNEARCSLATISSFTHNAQAYILGHLLCQPIDETVLWQRLASTQTSVRAALTDDFDTPRAVDAIMNLIHQCNCQLQTVSKTAGLSRSPAVFGAVLTYIRETMEVFGVDLLDRKDSSGEDSSGVLENVVEQLVHFRREIRDFALEPVADGSSGASNKKKQLHADRLPLLKACDALRNDLTPLGVHIKDRGTTSTWEITQLRRGKEENK